MNQILRHVEAMRAELRDDLTPRRRYDAVRRRLLARLDKIEAQIVRATRGADEVLGEQEDP